MHCNGTIRFVYENAIGLIRWEDMDTRNKEVRKSNEENGGESL